MKQISVIITILLLIICLTGISGCINTKVNSTWGEKKLSMDTIKVSNNTVGNRSENNDSIYYVSGKISNQNSFEALNLKMEVITYYANNTIFAVNNSPYINPKNIPANGRSYFYARFEDPDKKIARFEVKVLSAKGEY